LEGSWRVVWLWQQVLNNDGMVLNDPTTANIHQRQVVTVEPSVGLDYAYRLSQQII
jgi:hypothetical protein